METLSISGLQQLYGFNRLRCASETPPACKVNRSASPSGPFRVDIGTNYFRRSQWNYKISGRVLSTVIGSAALGNSYTEPLFCRARAILRPTNFPRVHGCVLDIGLGSTTLSTRSSRSKTRIQWSAIPGDGSSANASDSTLEGEGRAQDTADSSSSLQPTWISVLKKVDWNKFIFNWKKDEPMWKVPWTGQTVFQVMVLWFAAFWVMGSWVLPIAAQVAGFSRHSLTFRGQALYSLVTDIAEGAVGIWILRRCLARFFPLPKGWFPLKWRGDWLTEACLGCLLFPFVNRLSQLNLYLIPLPNLTTSYVEQSMMSRDPVATLLYAVVISICAPVWEEVIFRGFLLPSMTRYLPLWGAIFVSALAFALAHFNMQRILPLTFLGLVMGFVFVRSKNLLASIVLHSLWNGFAFLELL